MSNPHYTTAVFATALLVSACATTTTFEGLDHDQSGQVSRAEAGANLDDFARYDADGNGELNRQEYQQAYEATVARRELEQSLSQPSSRSSRGYGGGGGGGGFGS